MGDFGMSGDDLEQMYQEVILEAARDPHGREHFAADVSRNRAPHRPTRPCAPATNTARRANPTSSTPLAVTRRRFTPRSPTASRTPSSVWCGTATAARSRRRACPSWLTCAPARPSTRRWSCSATSMSSWSRAVLDCRTRPRRRSWRTPWCSRACQVPDAHQVRAAWLGGHARLRRQGAGGEINGHRTAMRAVRVVLLI